MDLEDNGESLVPVKNILQEENLGTFVFNSEENDTNNTSGISIRKIFLNF